MQQDTPTPGTPTSLTERAPNEGERDGARMKKGKRAGFRAEYLLRYEFVDCAFVNDDRAFTWRDAIEVFFQASFLGEQLIVDVTASNDGYDRQVFVGLEFLVGPCVVLERELLAVNRFFRKPGRLRRTAVTQGEPPSRMLQFFFLRALGLDRRGSGRRNGARPAGDIFFLCFLLLVDIRLRVGVSIFRWLLLTVSLKPLRLALLGRSLAGHDIGGRLSTRCALTLISGHRRFWRSVIARCAFATGRLLT